MRRRWAACARATKRWCGCTSSSAAGWKASCATTRRSCVRASSRSGSSTRSATASAPSWATRASCSPRGGRARSTRAGSSRSARRWRPSSAASWSSSRTIRCTLPPSISGGCSRAWWPGSRKARTGPETHLPRGSVGVIEADEDLLERAFENLVRNARDAAGPSGQVWIEVERGRDAVLVTVADDGPGMSPDVRSSLRPVLHDEVGRPRPRPARSPTRSSASTAATCSSPSALRAGWPCGFGCRCRGQPRTCRLRMVTLPPLEVVCEAPHISKEVELNQLVTLCHDPRYVDC